MVYAKGSFDACGCTVLRHGSDIVTGDEQIVRDTVE
jgi:hypothetical protein